MIWRDHNVQVQSAHNALQHCRRKRGQRGGDRDSTTQMYAQGQWESSSHKRQWYWGVQWGFCGMCREEDVQAKHYGRPVSNQFPHTNQPQLTHWPHTHKLLQTETRAFRAYRWLPEKLSVRNRSRWILQTFWLILVKICGILQNEFEYGKMCALHSSEKLKVLWNLKVEYLWTCKVKLA